MTTYRHIPPHIPPSVSEALTPGWRKEALNCSAKRGLVPRRRLEVCAGMCGRHVRLQGLPGREYSLAGAAKPRGSLCTCRGLPRVCALKCRYVRVCAGGMCACMGYPAGSMCGTCGASQAHQGGYVQPIVGMCGYVREVCAEVSAHSSAHTSRTYPHIPTVGCTCPP